MVWSAVSEVKVTCRETSRAALRNYAAPFASSRRLASHSIVFCVVLSTRFVPERRCVATERLNSVVTVRMWIKGYDDFNVIPWSLEVCSRIHQKLSVLKCVSRLGTYVLPFFDYTRNTIIYPKKVYVLSPSCICPRMCSSIQPTLHKWFAFAG